jgi:large subunit ribosomal protein L10
VPAINKLRGELLEHGARFTVVKNTLTRRAAEEAGADALLALLDGPTAIAFLETDGDPVAVAKALNAAVRETRVLEIRGGILEGQQIGQADVASLATLPPTDVLRGQLVSAVSGPLMTVVGLFTAPLRDLVNVIDARIKQLEEQDETQAAQEPEEAAETAAPEETPTEEPQAEAAEEAPQAADEAAAGEEVSPEAPAADTAVAEPAPAPEQETSEEETPQEE